MHSVYSRHNNRYCTIRKLSHLTSRRNWHLTRLGKSAKIPTPLSGGAGCKYGSRAKLCSTRPCCHFSKCSPHFTAFSVSSMWPHPPSHQAFTWLPIVSFSRTLRQGIFLHIWPTSTWLAHPRTWFGVHFSYLSSFSFSGLLQPCGSKYRQYGNNAQVVSRSDLAPSPPS